MKKKALAFALSLALCFGAALPSFAARPAEPTPEWAATVDHTYEAYQIFTGTYDATKDKLTAVEWGSAYTENMKSKLFDRFQTDKVKIVNNNDVEIDFETFNKENIGDLTAIDFAYAVEQYKLRNDLNAEYLAKIISENKGSAKLNVSADKKICDAEGNLVGGAAWYLVVDNTEDLNFVDDKGNNYAVYMDRPQLRFTTDGSITTVDKRNTISVDKKVKDICDSATVEYSGWQKSADYDFGDTIPFQVTGTLPADYDTYGEFEYVFEDEASVGILFDVNNFDYSVKLVNGDDETDIKSSFEIHTIEAHHFLIGTNNLKNIQGITKDSKIVLEYKGTLTGDGVVYGADGNPNKCKINFSDHINFNGSTPWDIAIVFTFKPQVNKIKPDGDELVGAKFKLYKYSKKTEKFEVVKDWDTGDISEFTCDGIDDGFYRIEEYEAPAGYNKIDDIYFEVEAVHTGKTLESLTVYETKADMTRTGVVFGSSDGQNNGWTVTILTNEHEPQFAVTVIDHEGVTLPSTGGIGTTIFYVVGGVLVVGAVVLLIVRRKMRTEEE